MKFIFNYDNWYRWIGKLKNGLSGICKYLETSYFPPPLCGSVLDVYRVRYSATQDPLPEAQDKAGKRSEWDPWCERGLSLTEKWNIVKYLKHLNYI